MTTILEDVKVEVEPTESDKIKIIHYTEALLRHGYPNPPNLRELIATASFFAERASVCNEGAAFHLVVDFA